MNKKLALVLYKYFPYGGLQKDFVEIAKELLSRGNILKVYTRSWEGEFPDDLEIIQLGETGVSNYSKNKKFIKKAFKALEDFEPDIIFGFNKMPGLDLYFAADSCFAFQSQSKPFYKDILEGLDNLLNMKRKSFLGMYQLRHSYLIISN